MSFLIYKSENYKLTKGLYFNANFKMIDENCKLIILCLLFLSGI